MYALFTARQLFFIAANSAIGFKPATNEESAPIKLIQDSYTNDYGLKDDDDSNVIMEPISSFGTKNQNSVYYSLNYPLLAQYSPETFQGKSLISLLEEVRHVANAYQESILANHEKVKSLYKVAASTSFSFYSSDDDLEKYKNILNSSLLETEDLRFTQDQSGEFPEFCSFLKCCIKISYNK